MIRVRKYRQYHDCSPFYNALYGINGLPNITSIVAVSVVHVINGGATMILPKYNV